MLRRLLEPRALRPIATPLAAASSSAIFARAFRAAPPLLAWTENRKHAPPTKWRWEPEPGQVAGQGRGLLRAEKRRRGEKSHNQKMDELRIERGERPRRLVKTRKRIPIAKHTHVGRFRMRVPGPVRVKQEWVDPEQATRDAMIQFIDPYELDPDLLPPGRQWHAAELRLKSNDDLAKLWVVLLKERNMLHTVRMQHKKSKTSMPHPGRVKDVRKSMGLIRVVLHEREREKRARDTRIKEQFRMEKALDHIDLDASAVWPPWIPGDDRIAPLAQQLTFNVVLRTKDGEKPSVRPEARHLTLSLTVDGEAVPEDKFDQHIVLRPAAPSRPDEMSYACHIMLHGNVVERSRFLLSPTKLKPGGAEGPTVESELRAALYGQEVGGGGVPVLLAPSKRLKRRVKIAEINETMSEALRQAREEAAREAGIDPPPLSPSPPPTEYWKPLNRPLM